VNEEPPRQSAGFGQGHQAEGSAGAGSVPPPPPNAGQGFGSAVQSGVDRLFPGRKSKLAAALLGIFLGAFGIHRFYLGFTTIGVIQLVLGLAGFVTCGITSLVSGIWGLVEGILILIGNINTDATGQPLTD
jgi:TM2 domain-containing membrane protein YozV